MKNYIVHNEWKIIEDQFRPVYNRTSESLFSLGNGWMGQRANFEEDYSGDTFQGNYVAGVYYPDKTRVGWWKNGYPEYFAKVLNAANWIGIHVYIDGTLLDLALVTVEGFRRELDMQRGLLSRTVTLSMGEKQVEIHAERFCSMDNGELGVVAYAIKPLNFSGVCRLEPYLDFDVQNEDANYDEKFWEEVNKSAETDTPYVTARTKKLDFQVCVAMAYSLSSHSTQEIETEEKNKYVSHALTTQIKSGEVTTLYKYVAICSSENHELSSLDHHAQKLVTTAKTTGFDALLDRHHSVWSDIWSHSDVVIDGDVSAQQGIRFNIFQLYQTYRGHDERLNIGPKGFTGEKYGGSTYWDTEAFCLPFFMSTADKHIPKNLLIYRYKHLDKAIENAERLGFTNGAALYPMVTMNGEECHNEWEITFEEIHRNGAIAYAIFDYIRFTGDRNYLISHGLEVLIAISRFWRQRVNFSELRNQYVMLGVTGPNEYENNVNNNWYTSTIAMWCLRYTMESMESVKTEKPAEWRRICEITGFDTSETIHWKEILNNMYLPEDEGKGIFLQQDGYLDKELIPVRELSEQDLPINQNWSWDRILRSCYIKQADVLQGLYFFEDEYDLDTLRRNYDFYEPLTVHESSLSPCVHSILAAKLGYEDKAYTFYLQTSRLDLDDYNNDTEDGCHITSMAGSWMSIVKGFAGMRVHNDALHLSPFVPSEWRSYAFKIQFRDHLLNIHVANREVIIQNESDTPIELFVFDQMKCIGSLQQTIVQWSEEVSI